MKTFLVGYILGIASLLAYQFRSKWLPLAKNEIDHLKHKDPSP